jgi:hypothetical protein
MTMTTPRNEERREKKSGVGRMEMSNYLSCKTI